jgi:hypothetical protein
MSTARPIRRWFQFGLTSMFITITVLAMLLIVVQLIPVQVSTFLAGALPAPILTIVIVRNRRRIRTAIVATCFAAWLAFYVVSIGPVAGLGMWLGLETNPLFHRYFDGFYTPVILLYQRTSLGRPIELYTDFWQHLGLLLR